MSALISYQVVRLKIIYIKVSLTDSAGCVYVYIIILKKGHEFEKVCSRTWKGFEAGEMGVNGNKRRGNCIIVF